MLDKLLESSSRKVRNVPTVGNWRMVVGTDVGEGAFFHSDSVMIFGWMAHCHMACYYLAIAACVICFLFVILPS